MTVQQQVDLVNFNSLQEISLSSVSGTVPAVCRFGTPLGEWVGASFTLSLNASTSALSYLYQQSQSLSAPTIPSNAAVFTMTTTGQVYLGFQARRDGSIDPNGPPHRVVCLGPVRVGPDVMDEQTVKDSVALGGARPYRRVLAQGTFTASSFAQTISALQHPERRAISLTQVAGAGITYVLMRNVGETEEVTSSNYWTALSLTNFYVERDVTNDLEFRCITSTGSVTLKYEVLA